MKEQDFAACLNLKDNYDLVDRVFYIGGRPCHLYYVDGFINNDVLQKIMESVVKYGEVFEATELVEINSPIHVVTSFGIPLLNPPGIPSKHK